MCWRSPASGCESLSFDAVVGNRKEAEQQESAPAGRGASERKQVAVRMMQELDNESERRKGSVLRCHQKALVAPCDLAAWMTSVSEGYLCLPRWDFAENRNYRTLLYKEDEKPQRNLVRS